jgi:delta 1-pyrroline-5-carboxylate dehydrogenase
LANDTEYGLSSSVWTSDPAKADRVARAIEAGNCCINDVMVSEGNTALPFGGIKQSGIGRYKGTFGLHSFSNIKSVMSDGGKKHSELHWYPYSPRKYSLLSDILQASEQGGLGGLVKLGLKAMKLEGLVKRHRL